MRIYFNLHIYDDQLKISKQKHLFTALHLLGISQQPLWSLCPDTCTVPKESTNGARISPFSEGTAVTPNTERTQCFLEIFWKRDYSGHLSLQWKQNSPTLAMKRATDCLTPGVCKNTRRRIRQVSLWMTFLRLCPWLQSEKAMHFGRRPHSFSPKWFASSAQKAWHNTDIRMRVGKPWCEKAFALCWSIENKASTGFEHFPGTKKTMHRCRACACLMQCILSSFARRGHC